MRVLVDTCIWSFALRRTANLQSPEVMELRRLIANHVVVMIGAIRQELLSGVRTRVQFDRLAAHLDAFEDIALNKEDFVTAARFHNVCRSHGVQGSNTDFLICAVSVNRNLSIFTTDQDFGLFAGHLPITLHKI